MSEPREKARIDEVLQDALLYEHGGIQPKVQTALTLIVAHLGVVERALDDARKEIDRQHDEIERQRRRIDQLEKIAHPPMTYAVGRSAGG